VITSPSSLDIFSHILYIDDLIVAVDKPSGLLSIPDGYHPDLPCLSMILQKELGNIWVVHRLDKETSGVILFARNAETHKALNLQFSAHKIVKEYHAVIEGIPPWVETTVDAPLKVNGDRRHRTIIDYTQGKPAQTRFTILEEFSQHSLVAANPLSGYTHQIRTHLSSIGFPILADTLYNARYKNPSQTECNAEEHKFWIDRLALHARQITFQNSVSKIQISIQAPYPVDFSDALEKFRHQN
jgi:tRNA pseudouridine32 synthase / 23S rRNA pseudouridine746 synthase